jgi:hypothetical protein
VVLQWSNAFELVLVNIFELFDNGIEVMGCNGNSVNVDGNILVDALTQTHPSIGVGLAWYKSHVSKCVGKPLVPAESITTQTVPSLADDEYETGEVSKSIFQKTKKELPKEFLANYPAGTVLL